MLSTLTCYVVAQCNHDEEQGHPSGKVHVSASHFNISHRLMMYSPTWSFQQTLNHEHIQYQKHPDPQRTRIPGPVSISEKTSFRKISWSLEATRLVLKLSYRFEIWQAHRQHCCRSACQISEQSDNSKYKSRDFETLRDLTERPLFGYWDGPLIRHWFDVQVSDLCLIEVDL